MAKENNYDVKAISYRKADGSTSDREIITIGDARETMLALQVDHLTPEQKNELQTFLRNQKAELSAKLASLNVEFKSFKPGMVTARDAA